MTTSTDRPHVVILGAGFAGLHAAKGLARAPVRITVVDRSNHHLFQPMLYQVATAALSPGDIASPIRSILRDQRNAEVLMAEAVRIRSAERVVELEGGASLPYDYLVVATGARHSYFGRDDWAALAPGLKNVEDGLEVRRRVLLAFEAAERETDLSRRLPYLNFVVIGAGPTGVEVAGALAEIGRDTLRRDFRRIDPRQVKVILVEGASRILPLYPAKLSRRAQTDLERLGVAVHVDTFVTDIGPEHVSAAGWTIPTHTVIWAAGNRASPLLDSLGAAQDRQGRVVVTESCSVDGHPELFVLGDAAAAADPRFGMVPAVCPAAIQMGRYAARAIRADLAGRPRPLFRYRDKGQLAVIGRGRAVADLGRLRFGGFAAWLAWIFVHIFFLIGFRNRAIVLFEWAWTYLTHQRGARLITGTPHGGTRSGDGSGGAT